MHGTAQLSTELANYKDELESWKLNKTIEENKFIEDTLSAGKNNLSYNGTQKEGNIKTIILDMKDEYIDELEIIKGELVLNTTNKTKINAAKVAKITVNPYKIIDGELMSARENLDIISSDGILTIPENVIKIGDGAFSGVEGLKTVIIPGTVKEIGANAFAYNTSLEEVIIQDGVEIIESGAFSYCTKLKNIEMTDSVTNMKDSVFSNDISLQNVKLSNNIKTISYALFYNCVNLSTIKIPEGVTTIEDLSFSACIKLDNIYISKNIDTISSGAFRGCTNLNVFTIDKQNQNFTIEDNIVYKTTANTKSLLISLSPNINKKEITIPEGVTNLFVGALGNFKKIETLNLPSTLSDIAGGWPFDGCGDTLKIITIPESNKTYKVVDNMILTKNGEKLIKASMNREEVVIPDSVKIVGVASITGGKIEKVIIGDNVETIEGQSFRNISKVTEFFIGQGVKNISPEFRQEAYFSGHVNLIINDENPNYVVEGNFILTKDRKNLISPINNEKNVVVPNGVETVESLALMKAETIKLPSSIKEIKNVGYNSNLKEIEIPNSCTKIATNAFVGCQNLETIKIKKKENSISGAPWGAVKGLKVVKWGD